MVYYIEQAFFFCRSIKSPTVCLSLCPYYFQKYTSSIVSVAHVFLEFLACRWRALGMCVPSSQVFLECLCLVLKCSWNACAWFSSVLGMVEPESHVFLGWLSLCLMCSLDGWAWVSCVLGMVEPESHVFLAWLSLCLKCSWHGWACVSCVLGMVEPASHVFLWCFLSTAHVSMECCVCSSRVLWIFVSAAHMCVECMSGVHVCFRYLSLPLTCYWDVRRAEPNRSFSVRFASLRGYVFERRTKT